MQPRMLVTFDEELNPLPVSVRVGQAVDVVGAVSVIRCCLALSYLLNNLVGWEAQDHHRVPDPHHPGPPGSRGEGRAGHGGIFASDAHHGGICHSKEKSRLLIFLCKSCYFLTCHEM